MTMASRLRDLLELAERWPEELQAEAVASLEAIEEELRAPYRLTQDDVQAIEDGLFAGVHRGS